MSLQLLLECAACAAPAPNAGRIRPDVQRDTGLVTVSPPAGWYAVFDTAPMRPAPAAVNTAPMRAAAPNGTPRAPRALDLVSARARIQVRFVCSPACAGALLTTIGQGMPEAFGELKPRPAARGAANYRAPTLTVRVAGPFPGNVAVHADHALLAQAQAQHAEEPEDPAADRSV
jgi:hypothetical protein